MDRAVRPDPLSTAAFRLSKITARGLPPEEFEGVNQPAVELRLALRERKLDEHQAAIAEDSHEHRNPASRGTDLHAANSPQSTCIA